MNILKTAIIFLIVFVGSLHAAPKSSQQAQKVVRGWLKAEANPLKMDLGQTVSRIETYTDDQGEDLYHVVYLDPSGFVIVPADDLIDPIIGFSAGGVYDPSPSNPFGALVSEDLPARMAAARGELPEQAGQKQGAAAREAALQKVRAKAQAKWAVFTDIAKGKGPDTTPGILKKIREAGESDTLEGDGEPLDAGLASISDIRVEPLVQSLWSQSQECGENCYNYYTPNNYVCGCVATAMSQLMRYHEYPTTGIGVNTFQITVDGNPQDADTRGGDGNGGPYNWSDMVLDPECSNYTDAAWEAIGALTYDAGVTVNMVYSEAGSGSDTLDAADAFKDIFGYSNAVKGFNGGNDIGANLNDMVNPNLDAGYPALLGITGSVGGHAIVVDGYGYNSTTLYNHLNMGWAGSDDAWYNLPNIDSSPSFTLVYKCIYNVFVSGTGEIISGRVIDAVGNPLSGVTVTATGPGGPYSNTTNLNGIYALTNVQSSSTYTLTAGSGSMVVTTGTSTDYAAVSGNVWGADIVASDIMSPTPDPMEWEVEPVAVGETTIFMKAVTATHASGVEYYIDCETALENFEEGNGKDSYGDTQFDSRNNSLTDPSGWVTDTTHYRGDYETGVEYYFRVRARSLDNGEETQWSEIVGPITPGTGLPPYPDPAMWKGTPRKISNSRISMEAVVGYDEYGTQVEYFFECVSTTDPKYSDPNDPDYIGLAETLSSDWQTNTRYDVAGLSVGTPGNEYVFRVKMRDAAGNETDWTPEKGVILAPPPVIREVPSTQYSSIQSAIAAANHGDTVRVHPGIHSERNIDFMGKKITVRSENPEDPAIVAATIVDCGGALTLLPSWSPARAFVFQNGEGRDSVVAGFTIQDAFAVNYPQTLFPPFPEGTDPNGIDALGGAILGGVIEYDVTGQRIVGTHTPASPTIRNCVFQDCYAYGQDGTDGRDEPGAGQDTPGANGGPGQDGGHGMGGAMYFVDGSSPLIKECRIQNCYAIGGIGGDGGDGGNGGNGSDGAPGQPGGNGGRGGWGGNAWGGAIYFEPNCLPELYDVTISGCYARVGEPGSGGAGGNGGNAGNGGGAGGDGGIGGDAGDLRAEDIAGGALYCGENIQLLMDRVEISDCHTDADISGQYNGGAGGNGGDGNGDGAPGGNGGKGGDCWAATGWWNLIGGAWATAGNGGSGGAGGNNGPNGAGGNGGNGGDEGGSGGNGNPNGADGLGFLNLGNLFSLRTYGGANYYAGNSLVTATDYVVENSYAFTDLGGGEYFESQCKILYTNCRIQNNTTFYENDNGLFLAGVGGGVYVGDPNRFEYVDSVISDNISVQGGGIYFDADTPGAALVMTGCTLTGNEANVDYQGSWGGAIYAGNMSTADDILAGLETEFPYDITMTDCEFTGNVSPYGGAICVDAVNLTVTDCQFEANVSEYGGGVYSNVSNTLIQNSNYHQNSARDTDAIVIDSPNAYCSGPGLYSLNSILGVVNTVFTDNQAVGFGGAALISGPAPDWTMQQFTNCLFVENSAGLEGGAMAAIVQSEVQLSNNTFVDNVAENTSVGAGGALLCYDAFVDASNTIFWDNLAVFGPQISVGEPVELVQDYDPDYIPYSTVFVNYSDVQGGEADVFVGPGDGPWLWYGSNNIEDDPATEEVDEADPLFAPISEPNDVTERTFYLSQVAAGQLENSPCLNAGIGAADDLATLLGFDITTRTDHAPDANDVDMGYHYDASLPVAQYVLTTEVYVADRFPHGKLEVTTDPNNVIVVIDPNTSRAIYRFKQGAVVELKATPDANYRVARWIGADSDPFYYDETNTVTMTGYETAQVEFELAVPKNLYVPESYDTIEDAVQAARSGDTIILAPRPGQPYTIQDPTGIHFGQYRDRNGELQPVELVIRSVDPNDPQVVASTIIDAKGRAPVAPTLNNKYRGSGSGISKRAFLIDGGQTNQTRIEGLTIRNAFTAVIGESEAIDTGMWPMPFDNIPDPPPPVRALSGEDATGDSYGGAVLIESGSSPVIYKCIFENCTVAGGIGGNGADGDYPSGLLGITEDLDSQSGGHSGKGVGDGYGGAIAVIDESNPIILECEFTNNRATGGWGGIAGDAGRAYNNGRYGWGGNDWSGLSWAETYAPGINDWFEAGNGFGDGHGGAIFVAAGCNPTLRDCVFEDNYARTGYVARGGDESPNGGAYPEPWDADPWGQAGIRDGRPGMLTDNGTIAGGAIYFEENADVTLEGCRFIKNEAYDVDGVFTDGQEYAEDQAEGYYSRIATRGGALYADPNVTVTIRPVYDPEDPNLILAESLFEDNLAGAIYCSTGINLQIEETEFTDNISYLDPEQTLLFGGFFDDFDAEASFLISLLDDSEVVPVARFDTAGAITVEIDPEDSENTKQIENCSFSGSASHVGGGAIRTDSDINIKHTSFNGNTSRDNGGAFYSYYHIPDPNTHTVKLDFENCEFSGNESEGLGGAGFAKTAILNMQQCYFLQNKAYTGGALYADASVLELTDILAYENAATGLIEGRYRPVVDEGVGGGLAIVDCTAAIVDSRILYNTASGVNSCGGGICLAGGQTYKDLNLLNCLVANNTSENAGGGISCVKKVSVQIDNCTIADNTSGNTLGGGIYIDNTSDVNMKDSILSGNTGYGLYEKPLAGDSVVAFTLFNANTPADMFDAQTGASFAASQAPGYSNVLQGDPMYMDGPLDGYYLDQTTPSPAVNGGSKTAAEAMLDSFTTDPDETPDQSLSPVDLGYHFVISNNVPNFILTAQVQDNAGTVTPASGTYPRGAVVPLTATIDDEYFLTGWSGGTVNDNSRDSENTVLMMRDKQIEVEVRFRRTLNVGTSAQYATLGDALDDAQDGDVVLIAPGIYTAASQFPSSLNEISLSGKQLTISGANPDDDSVVRATVFNNFSFILSNLDENTVIEGITLQASRMYLYDANPMIRNCVFTECQFFDGEDRHEGNPPGGTDGYHQDGIFGGAMQMYQSSPTVMNCVFEDNWVEGADGEDGFAGDQGHPDGGDGGFPSQVYGGAVYCGLSSEPEFIGCTFTGNEAFAANGGRGADFVTIDTVAYDGGRGGGWVYDDVGEAYLQARGWDGWGNNDAGGNKYTIFSPYALFYGDYDLEVWKRWFNWDDSIASWDNFFSNPPSDPHDRMLDTWRHSAYGGAVYCELDSDVTFKDCTFENNQTHGGLTGQGGLHPLAEPEWPDRQLNMPTAGGAVFAALDSDLTFENCVFRNNTADTSTVELPHTYQVSFGGAVAYEFDCNVKFTDCEIQENRATVGGGIYGSEAMSEIVDCDIYNNEAYLGGGAFLEDANSVVSGTLFRANRATAPDVTIEPPDPDDPDAPVVPTATLDLIGEGAGLFAHTQHLQIRDSIFVENRSDISGGGLYLSGTVEQPANISNSLFIKNIAARDGAGASVNWMTHAVFGNCTFVDNFSLGVSTEVETGQFEEVTDPNTGEVTLVPVTEIVQDNGYGGGLYLAYDSVADVNDSIFWGNVATDGDNIAVGADVQATPRPSTLTVSHAIIENFDDEESIYVGEGCTLTGFDPLTRTWPAEYNIFSEDPLFETPTGVQADEYEYQFFLQQQDSPAIDAGSRPAAEAGLLTTSIFYDPDVDQVDLGYHYNRSAIPDDPDDGVELTVQILLDGSDPHGRLEALYPGGSFEVTNEPNGVTVVLKPGTIVQLRATADADYRVEKWFGTDDDTSWRTTNSIRLTEDTQTVQVQFDQDIPKFLYVPDGYPTLDEAVIAARNGDTIVLGMKVNDVYQVTLADGYNFGDRQIHLTSEDPDDPFVVANTVIDVGGSSETPRRAFTFDSGQDPNTIIEGVTIRNGYKTGPVGREGLIPGTVAEIVPPYPLYTQNEDAVRANSGEDAVGDGYGGAILVTNGSSPTIRKCVFENNTVIGAIGGDGADGIILLGIGLEPAAWAQSGGNGGDGIGNGYGGAIAVIDESNPFITDCTFRNNRAAGASGGRGGDGYPVDEGEDLILSPSWGGNGGNGAGGGRGGAVYVAAGCNPNLRDNVFEGNEATSGIFAEGGVPSQTGTLRFTWWPSEWYSDPTTRAGQDGTIDLTDAGGISGGAVAYGEDANTVIAGSTFINNRAYASISETEHDYTRGGAIYIDPNAILSVVDCNFIGNIGGAVYAAAGDRTELYVDECRFRENASYDPAFGQDGIQNFEELFGWEVVDAPAGGVTVAEDAKAAVITNSHFAGNLTEGPGGAVQTHSDITIQNCTFGGNQAILKGGAFYAYRHIPGQDVYTLNVMMEDCEFTSNLAEWAGGAVFTQNTVFNTENCQFIENTAPSGGGLMTLEGQLDMSGGLLLYNEAGLIDGTQVPGDTVSDPNDGPVSDPNSPQDDPGNTSPSTVQDGFGGAVYAVDSNVDIRDTRILENSALGLYGGGGGLYLKAGVGHAMNVSNSLITGNRSSNDGGGVALKTYVNAAFNNCTIADNSTADLGGGMFVDWSSQATILNSIIAGNSPTGLYEQSTDNGSADAVVTATLFNNNGAGDVEEGDLYDAQTQAFYTGADQLNSVTGVSDAKDGDPVFTAGPLGDYYLGTSSPAVNAGNVFAGVVGLDTYTTRIAIPVIFDTGVVDVGYHYEDPTLRQFVISGEVVEVVDEVEIIRGTLEPSPGTYYFGQIVDLTANISDDYVVIGWSGGTFDDSLRQPTNTVLVNRDKQIQALVRQRQTIYVGGSTGITDIQSAIDAAEYGDQILVNPGTYTPVSGGGEIGFRVIDLVGKTLGISGTHPDDETVTRSTVLDQYEFRLINASEDVVIEGITIRTSGSTNESLNGMIIHGGSPVIRNVIFSDCGYTGGTLGGTAGPSGTQDGGNGVSVLGGAVSVFEASPQFVNCTFENNFVQAGNGADGASGGNGGWPGRAYGGAVYVAFSSEPVFNNCTFTGNLAFGGIGGNAADGGRGGGWKFEDTIENNEALWTWWLDGWLNGDKYTFYDDLALAPYNFSMFEKYSWLTWSEWFNWDQWSSWPEFRAQEPLVTDAYEDYEKYSGYGGAVYVGFLSNARFVDCVFEDNQTQGGLSGVGTVPDRQINIPNAGGAVYAGNDSAVEFSSCVFRNNLANTSTVDVPHTFQTSFGGAVAYEYGCDVTIANCDIQDNTATVGGGIYGFDGLELSIVDCNVFSNEAYIGAGLYLDDKLASITGSLIHGNRAKVPGITIEPPDPDDPDNPVVPTATLDLIGEGGGLYAHVMDLSIRDTMFIANEADISSGALLLSGIVDEPADIFNCLFADNTTQIDGGAASVNWNSQALFGNCSFVNNVALGIYSEVETGEFEPAIDPETGEPLLDQDGNPVLVPVTTQVQVSEGTGGGLNVSYDSIAEVIDSIFWYNFADQGDSIYLGTSPTYERPSELTVSYSDVANYPSANAIYVEEGCTFNPDPNGTIFSQDPVFVTLPGAATDDVMLRYYLNQQNPISPCIDAGSDFASTIGLSNYTTSIFSALDKGLVDLGYHYRKADVEDCRLADLALNGTIDLSDWAAFASEWISLAGTCGEGNNWCNGADQNFDTEVNAEDLMNFAVCWLTVDDKAPLPSPAEWETEPSAVLETYNKIEMAAKIHHDAWWPDQVIKYQFYSGSQQNPSILYVDQDANHDGFLTYDELGPESMDSEGINVVQIYATKTGLEPSSYLLFVKAFDGSNNSTEQSQQVAPVTPGENTELPAAQWLNEPFVTGDQFAIEMEAVAYEDFQSQLGVEVPTLPAGYVIKYQFDYTGTADGGDGRFYDFDPVYVDTGMVEGQTYSYRVRMGLFYEPGDGSSVKIKDSAWSTSVSVEAVSPDLTPPNDPDLDALDPLYHTAKHASGSPFEVFVASQGVYFHIVTSILMEDDSDVEYKFVCSNSYYSSGNDGDPDADEIDQIDLGYKGSGPENGWRNADNVADLLYPNGEVQTPEQYWAKRGLSGQQDTWTIIVRDRSPNQNTTDPSEARTISTPAP